MSKSLIRVSLFAMILVAQVAAYAFTGTVTSRKETPWGTSKLVSLAGNYMLSPGESIASVRIFTLDANKRQLSSASGTFNATSWAASVGDYQLSYYYVAVDVVNSGRHFIYYTPQYQWQH